MRKNSLSIQLKMRGVLEELLRNLSSKIANKKTVLSIWNSKADSLQMSKEKVRNRVRKDSKNPLMIKSEISQLFLSVRFILMKSINIMITLEENCFVLSVFYLNPGIMILDR